VIGSPSVYGSAAHDDHLPGELRSRSNAALGLTEMQGPLPDTLGKKVGKPVSSERTRATEARLLKREAWLTAMLEPTVALRFTMFGFCTQPTSWEGFVDRRVPEHLVWAVTAGELSAKIAGRSWLLRPGGFCLLPPETLHTFVHGEPRQPLVVHLFRFELLRGNVLLHLPTRHPFSRLPLRRGNIWSPCMTIDRQPMRKQRSESKPGSSYCYRAHSALLIRRR
jgi:hypothetical protein